MVEKYACKDIAKLAYSTINITINVDLEIQNFLISQVIHHSARCNARNSSRYNSIASLFL